VNVSLSFSLSLSLSIYISLSHTCTQVLTSAIAIKRCWPLFLEPSLQWPNRVRYAQRLGGKLAPVMRVEPIASESCTEALPPLMVQLSLAAWRRVIISLLKQQCLGLISTSSSWLWSSGNSKMQAKVNLAPHCFPLYPGVGSHAALIVLWYTSLTR
jgi:hypothetical protein